MTPWIQTYSGLRLDLINPKPEQVDVVDIAHALSMIPRFGGHVKEFYSVAQHSVIVSNAVESLCGKYGWEGLFHDVTEYAGYGDITSPGKGTLQPTYNHIVGYLEQQLALILDLEYPFPDEVHDVDSRVCATEHKCLMSKEPEPWVDRLGEPFDIDIKPLPWNEAKQLFLNRCAYLKDKENRND